MRAAFASFGVLWMVLVTAALLSALLMIRNRARSPSRVMSIR